MGYYPAIERNEGIYVCFQLIHVIVQQITTQHCKAIKRQFKINKNLFKKKNKVLIHATTWRKLGNILLSEISQTQKATQIMTVYMKCPEQATL